MKTEQGFTLIEVLIATAIFGLGLLMYLALTGNIMSTNDASKKNSIATALAQDKIEYIKDLGMTWDFSGADALDSPDISGGAWSANVGGETVDAEGDTGTSGAIFTRTWTITPVAGEFFIYDVAVNLAWEDGGSQSISLITQNTQ